MTFKGAVIKLQFIFILALLPGAIVQYTQWWNGAQSAVVRVQQLTQWMK